MFLKSLLLWLIMLLVAVAFGALRETVLTPLLGDTAARALCSVALSGALYLLVARFVRRHGPSSTSGLLLLGVFLAGMTLVFEFGMGFLRGASLDAMLADYNVFEGRLWPLVPLTLFAGPLVARRGS